jgi:hypothetical protein
MLCNDVHCCMITDMVLHTACHAPRPPVTWSSRLTVTVVVWALQAQASISGVDSDGIWEMQRRIRDLSEENGQLKVFACVCVCVCVYVSTLSACIVHFNLCALALRYITHVLWCVSSVCMRGCVHPCRHISCHKTHAFLCFETSTNVDTYALSRCHRECAQTDTHVALHTL